MSGNDGGTVASTGPGLLRLSWYTEEACAESGPAARADVDEARHRIVIEQRRLGAQYRCAGRPQRYRTTLTGLLGGVYSLEAPGLGQVFIQVPAAVTPGVLRVRTVEEPVAAAPPAGPRPPSRPLPAAQDITDPWR